MVERNAEADRVEVRRRPLRSRFSFVHLVAVVAGLVTMLALLSWTRGQEDLSTVVVASSDIAAGTLVSDGSLGLMEVPASASVTAVMVPGDERVTLVGQVAARSITAGEPILRSDVRAPVDQGGRRQMSVPIARANAVGGSLAAGDRVDALVVSDDATRFVAEGMAVLAVPDSTDDGFGAAASSGWWVVLAVTDSEALEIGDALEHGTLHLLRSTGTPALMVTELPRPDPTESDPGGDVGVADGG